MPHIELTQINILGYLNTTSWAPGCVLACVDPRPNTHSAFRKFCPAWTSANINPCIYFYRVLGKVFNLVVYSDLILHVFTDATNVSDTLLMLRWSQILCFKDRSKRKMELSWKECIPPAVFNARVHLMLRNYRALAVLAKPSK